VGGGPAIGQPLDRQAFVAQPLLQMRCRTGDAVAVAQLQPDGRQVRRHEISSLTSYVVFGESPRILRRLQLLRRLSHEEVEQVLP